MAGTVIHFPGGPVWVDLSTGEILSRIQKAHEDNPDAETVLLKLEDAGGNPFLVNTRHIQSMIPDRPAEPYGA